MEENKEKLQENIEENENNQNDNEVLSVDETKEEHVKYTGKKVKMFIRYDFKAMKYYQKYVLVYRRKFPIVYFILGLLSFVFAAYEIYQGFTSEDINTFGIIIGALFVFMGAYFIYSTFAFDSTIDKRLMQMFNHRKPAEQFVEIRDDKILLTPADKPDDEPFPYDWVYVTEIHEIPEYFYVYIGKTPLIIPKDPNCITEGTYEDLDAILDDKIKTKKYKKITKELVKKPITYVHPEFDPDDADEVQNETVEVNNENETTEVKQEQENNDTENKQE